MEMNDQLVKAYDRLMRALEKLEGIRMRTRGHWLSQINAEDSAVRDVIEAYRGVKTVEKMQRLLQQNLRCHPAPVKEDDRR